jgi:adenine-specific DNA-methyltransferase
MAKDTLLPDLCRFAAEQQRRFDAATPPQERKKRGHFGTPQAIAEFMADLISEIPSGTLRILDPGAGVGILSAALCQRILREHSSRRLEIEMWESDPKLVPHLRRTIDHCRKSLIESGHQLDYTIHKGDFVLANTQKTLFDSGPDPSFHLTLLNPPYYKVRKESAQALAMEHVVHGQPNIYAFFMAVAADLLLPAGKMVAITPRSYFNGTYFRQFRQWFFQRMTARHIHLFESRTEAFNEDAVLQENVILLAEKCGKPSNVVLTTSHGRDLADVERTSAEYEKVLDNSKGAQIVRVATSSFEHDIVETLDALPSRLRDLEIEVSTGPVVTFRSTDYLRYERSEDTAPLLWMHNVRPFVTQYPPRKRKPAHIAVGEGSMRLLLPAKRYILLKRFTAKEEKKRLVAGIMEASDSYSQWVGLENHLNYVYRRGGDITRIEAIGLAAYFNSVLLDRYFRTVSGNTQVNAAEMRRMPMPDRQVLMTIGNEVALAQELDFCTIERVVGRILGLPKQMIEKLCEVAR